MTYVYLRVAFSLVWGEPTSPEFTVAPGVYAQDSGGELTLEPLALHWSEQYGFYADASVSFSIGAPQ